MKKNRTLRVLLVLGLIALGLFLWWKRREGAAVDSGATVEAAQPTLGNRIVVDFRDDESHERVAALGRELGVDFLPASSQVDVDEIYVAFSQDAERVLAALRDAKLAGEVEAADYDIDYAIPEDDAELAADEGLSAEAPGVAEKGFPNDPRFAHQWHMDQIHVKGAWKLAQGEGVIVAVIDTGVARVPDLAQTELVAGYNFVANNADATDDHGHGTHVAGTIAQSTHNGVGVAGIAFKSKIMPIKVLSARGSGSVSGIAEGIRFAADHGAKVINMSLGGPMATTVLKNAIKYAHDKGVTVVCAAGNDGRGKVSYPASYPHSIAVAATQFDETTTFYSNWGKEIDIAAPGGNTRVDQNGDGMPDGVLQNTVVPGDTGRNDYLWFMGTSMAAPHVAGVAALVISAGVTDPDAVEKILKSTARAPKTPPSDKQNRYGAGIIDAEAAVKAARSGKGAGELVTALFVGAAALLLGRRGRGARLAALGASGAVALVVAAGGLFFIPQLGAFSQGLPAWDLAFGAGAHGNPLTYSALVPLLLAGLFFAWKGARGVLVGVAIGVGGHLLYHAFARTLDVQWIPNALDSAWLFANGAVSLVLARLLARK